MSSNPYFPLPSNNRKFKDKFKGPGPVQINGDGPFDDTIKFSDDPYNCQYAIIKNVEFNKGIVLESIENIGVGIKFVNCKGSQLVISGCRSSGYDNSFDSRGNSVILEGCEFRLVIIESTSMETGILIEENSRIHRLSLSDLTFKHSPCTINNSSLNHLVDIHRLSSPGGDIRIHQSEVSAKLKLFEVRLPSISFSESGFSKDIRIDRCEVDMLYLNESRFLDSIKFTGNIIKRRLVAIGSSFSSLELKYYNSYGQAGTIKEVYLDGCSTVKGLFMDGYSGPNSEITRGCLNNLEIQFNKSLDGDFKFQNLDIKKLGISGVNPSANLELNYCDLHDIKLDKLNNNGLITFMSCEATGENPKIFFTNSYLGKTRFFNFNFAQFTNIHIVDSVLIDIICVRVTWFSDDQLLRSDLERLLHNNDNDEQKHQYISGHYGIRREIYRQIKYALEKQGDRTQALRFQARELEAHRKELKFNKKRHFNDRLTLWFSRTNNMGVNWLRPLAWLFGATIFFFLLFVWSLSDNLEMYYPPKIIDFSGSFTEYHKYLHILPQLFNPARVLERMLPVEEGKHLSGWIYTIDAIHRVILAFFIFQIVSAFRKYVKS
ncbi:MAG: hypothetical protein AAF944_10790 [Bacteroidota bacterium]